MNLPIAETLQALKYVQVGETTAYIDSRVYCNDIIQVNHSDWLRDTFYKHQSEIEKKFGIVTFRSGMDDVITSLLSGLTPESGNVTTKYALLTEAQCNACLVLSKNQAKTVEAKLALVADFETAKKAIKLQFQWQLERQATQATEAATTAAASSNLLETIAELEEAKWQLELWVEGYEAELHELAESKRQLQEQLLAQLSRLQSQLGAELDEAKAQLSVYFKAPYTPTPAIAQQPLIARLQARISQLELELVFKETQNPVGYDYHFCQVWKMTGIVNRQVFYNKARALLVRGVDYDDREDDLFSGFCMTYPAMIKVLLTLRSRKGIQRFCLRGGLTLEKLKIYKRLGIERLTALFPKVV